VEFVWTKGALACANAFVAGELVAFITNNPG
jgi:hypothetical protein